MFILWLTGIVFIATEVALFYFMWKYDADEQPRAGEVLARQPHAGSRLDDPAGGDAAVHRDLPDERLGRRQDAAARHSDHRRGHRPAVQLGRPLSRAPTASCTRRTTSSATTARSTCRSDEEVLLMIKSADVLHSFFLPNLRMKQDVVPGMDQIHVVQGHGHRRVRHRLRRAVRLGPLQDEGPRPRSSRATDYEAWLERNVRPSRKRKTVAATNSRRIIERPTIGSP